MILYYSICCIMFNKGYLYIYRIYSLYRSFYLTGSFPIIFQYKIIITTYCILPIYDDII